MPLANYTTKVPVEQSITEIERLLSDGGAIAIAKQYDGGKPVGIDFTIKLDGFPLQFRLPINVAAAQKALTAQKVRSYHRTPAHSEAVSWRIMKDWVKLQLTMIELRQAEMAQVFMPYAIAGGQTVYEAFRAGRQKELGSGVAK